MYKRQGVYKNCYISTYLNDQRIICRKRPVMAPGEMEQVKLQKSDVYKRQVNAYKRKGTPVTEIFQYMFLLIFSNRSMYMSLLTGKNTPNFAKDTVYRFMKMVQINWMRFTTILASRIINNAILSLDSEDRANVLIIDDSMFERNRSKKVIL